MQPIYKMKIAPKMIVVNAIPEANNWNKHLLKPFIKGGIVKVHPTQDKKNFVRVIRKDAEGNWTIVYVESCKSFDLLKAK